MKPRLPPIQKPVIFEGTSRDDLRAFPEEVKFNLGHQLDQVQRGLEPDDWKAMPSVGPGVYELRDRDADGWYRLAYIARLADGIHVLHAFQKKTSQTTRQDVELIRQRLAPLLEQQRQRKR